MKSYKYVKATQHNNQQAPPIWLMRQAGRYLPEYRAVRKNYTFNQMISNPEIVTEITIQPIKRYGFDAAILYSDILVVPNAFGLYFDFIEKKGPVLSHSLDLHQIEQHFNTEFDLSTCQFVFDSVKLLKKELTQYNIPLIGFAGCPFTVACYIIQGQSSKTFNKVTSLMHQNPTLMHLILNKLTDATIDYLKAQIHAGVEAIQLFDTWASLLNDKMYDEFSFNYIRKICNELATFKLPITLFSKHSVHHLTKQLSLPIQVISVDTELAIGKAREMAGKEIALQGNLNPEILLTDKATIEIAVKDILTQMKGDPGFIFNLGHGILPTTPLDHVQLVVDLVKNA